ncbi:MAG: folylpolyglutamate synthase/dihydrofolate synthase family protein [Acutalibacteraceae bacterium]|nr:folylpolyglutamate synthase/dihydrofolate synthase family protein [Acutalibacteraceae bacterium]
MDYTQTLEYIHSLGNFKLPAGLERITEALKKLENPQKNFDSIHIAGTNGKGSVCTMLAKIFETAGFKTGLYISPYIIDFRERIQINGNFISEDKIAEYAVRVKNTGVEMSEFEFITAMAFSYFADENCDIVIAETGLGGRLDATNTLERVKTAVITKIGLDHIGILGDTLEKIAAEKCGIVKNFPTVSSPCQKPEVFSVIKRYAESTVVPDVDRLQIIKSDFSENSFIYKGHSYNLSLCGEYQIENAVTAIEAVKQSGYNIPYDTVRKALENTFFPARNEVVCKKPLIVLDGAHNPDSAEALSGVMKKYSGKITAIIGVMRDKDYKTVLSKTLIHCRNAVAVTVKDMPRSLDCESLAAAAGEFCPCCTASDYDTAIKKAVSAAGENPIFVFGSLYLASGIRDALFDIAKKINSDT